MLLACAEIRNVNFLLTANVAKIQISNLEEDVIGKNWCGTGHPTGVQLCHGSPAVGPTRSAAAVSFCREPRGTGPSPPAQTGGG